MTVEPLVFTTRERNAGSSPAPDIDSSAVENVHFGSIAVVAVDGRLMHSVGDPHWSTFTRSTLKPFQALPFIREGGHERFGWNSRQVALMCASHSGEAMHTDLVESMLRSADCDEVCLQCGCHVPGWYAATGTTAPVDMRWSSVQHNCSGKHAGFLASCRLHGEGINDYLDPVSGLQQRIAKTISEFAGIPASDLAMGIDGCSAPNFALPLSRLALFYAWLAQGSAAPVEGSSLAVLRDAMTRHPELVSGTARSDLTLMSLEPGDWVTKIGADGVQAIGIRSLGLGIAIKVSDGNRDALYCALVEVLSQLGLLGDADRAARIGHDGMGPWQHRALHNARSLMTGRTLPAFKLRTA